MERSIRRAAAAALKETKVSAGIYLVRASKGGGVWVGRAPNLAAIENRVMFSLRTGSHPSKSLQAAFDAAPDSLCIEIAERLPQEAHPSSHNRLLQARVAAWAEQLGAERL